MLDNKNKKPFFKKRKEKKKKKENKKPRSKKKKKLKEKGGKRERYWLCHFGIDNLHVARTIGRLLDRDSLVKPLPLAKDGDLIALGKYVIRTRGRETVRVTKVKGPAEDLDVQQGRARLVDQLRNAKADAAADLGGRNQSEVLIDARRRLLSVRSYWYPIMLQLHRFMNAVAGVTVNHDGRGGTAPDPFVGSGRSKEGPHA